eukprot:474859_1
MASDFFSYDKGDGKGNSKTNPKRRYKAMAMQFKYINATQGRIENMLHEKNIILTHIALEDAYKIRIIFDASNNIGIGQELDLVVVNINVQNNKMEVYIHSEFVFESGFANAIAIEMRRKIYMSLARVYLYRSMIQSGLIEMMGTIIILVLLR